MGKGRMRGKGVLVRGFCDVMAGRGVLEGRPWNRLADGCSAVLGVRMFCGSSGGLRERKRSVE